jgi:hypothetical protein
MKRTLILFSAILMISILSSCSKEDASIKKNWIFTITTVTTYTPSDGVSPMTTVVTQEVDNITEAEAEETRKGLEMTSTVTLSGTTMTMKVTATKAEKK